MHSPKTRRGCGCLLNLLIGFVLLVLALACSAYLGVRHTALPVQAVAALFERVNTNRNLRIEGVSGSISSGFRIKSVRWTGGEMTGVRARTSGLLTLLWENELILRQVQIGQARLDIADWNRRPASDKALRMPLLLTRYRMDRLTCQHLVLTNRLTGLSLTVPGLEWTGFKRNGHAARPEKMDLGRVKLEPLDTPLSLPDALAKVFHGQGHAQLPPTQQNDIDEKLSGLFGPGYLSPGLPK